MIALTFSAKVLLEKNMQPSGYGMICNTIKRLLAFNQEASFSKITEEDVRNYLQHSSLKKNWTAKTFRNQWQACKSFFDWAVCRKYCSKNPVLGISRPKLPEYLPRCISHEQAQKVLFQCSWYPWKTPLQRIRNKAIISTFMMTGIRLNELLHLQGNDVDLNSETILVRKGKGRKERSVPIHPKLRPILKEYLRNKSEFGRPSNWFFHGLNSTKRLYPRDIHVICRLLSIAAQVKFTPHMLRHTFARELCDADFDIRKLMDLLGHRHITTTQRYTSLSQNRIRNSFINTSFYTT